MYIYVQSTNSGLKLSLGNDSKTPGKKVIIHLNNYWLFLQVTQDIWTQKNPAVISLTAVGLGSTVITVVVSGFIIIIIMTVIYKTNQTPPNFQDSRTGFFCLSDMRTEIIQKMWYNSIDYELLLEFFFFMICSWNTQALFELH